MFKQQTVTGIWSLGCRLYCAVLKMPYYTGKQSVFDNSHGEHVDYILATRYLWRQVLDRVGEQSIKGHNLHIY